VNESGWHLQALIAACSLMTALPLIAAEPEEQLEELEHVLVIGEQPGPGLWKVSRGDHVMWVLASHSPLPRGMKWQSQQVEARIAESQEVLYAGGVRIDTNVGLLRGLTLIPAALSARKLPERQTLKDVLEPATYNRWLALRQKYIGKDDDVERLRPALALMQLRSAASRKSALGGLNVVEVVGEFRKKHKVASKRLPAESRTVRVENPRGILKRAGKLDVPDVECFTRGLEEIEPEIERARALANAWSRGDIETLRNLHRNRRIKDIITQGCTYALMTAVNEGEGKDAANMKQLLADLEWHAEQASVQAQRNWIAAAERSLAKNRSTFAVLGVAEVFSPDGHLAKLRELGYTVEEPR
jgi:hypothetical protein